MKKWLKTKKYCKMLDRRFRRWEKFSEQKVSKNCIKNSPLFKNRKSGIKW